MASILITGCSRGFGLELVRQLSYSPVEKVIATSRSPTPSADLSKIIESSRIVSFIQLDQIDEDSVKRAAKECELLLNGSGLDILINNAAAQYDAPGSVPSMRYLDETMRSNVTGVHCVTANFLHLLRRGQHKKVINISSTLGSLAMAKDFASIPVAAYKISKAALNMLTLQYALELANEGFIVMAISPGNMKTAIGGGNAELEVKDGAAATLSIILNAKRSDNGRFQNISILGNSNYNGEYIAW